MQHQMKLSAEPFEKIWTGKKVIESRLYDEKRKQIFLGDEIEFSENDNSESKVNTKVVELLRYNSFQELFRNHNPSLFGGEDKESLLQEIKQFYSDEDEQKYGVVGIRVRLLEI